MQNMESMIGAIPDGATSLALPSEMDFAAFMSVGHIIAARQRNSLWLLGDWTAYGERTYGEQFTLAFGEVAPPKMLRHARKVAEQFPAGERIQSLSFNHYQHLSDLPHGEAKKLLATAQKENLTESGIKTAAIQIKAELGQSNFVDDDWENQQARSFIRAWNNLDPGVRRYCLPVIIEADYGTAEI